MKYAKFCRGMAAVLAGVTAAAAVGCGTSKPEGSEAAKTGAPVSEVIDPATLSLGPEKPARYAIARTSPAVVRLDVVAEVFSDGQPHSVRSIGSGVIIDPAGHVLTNFHVAGRAKQIEITLANLEHVRATLVGSDHWTDLALVQLDLEELKRRKLAFAWAPLGDSAQVQLGQPVMAMGTPHGLSRTLTAGIISNTDRFFDESDIDGYETGWFNNWLQTDAAINPGNSGGPLINLRGEVIGINTRAMRESNNLGFAIPSNVCQQVVGELLKQKKVRRSYIGIALQPLQDLETYFDLATDRGVLIRSVDPDSPAKAAGVEPEDILLAINGQPVNARFPEQIAAVRKLVSDQPVGSKLQLTIRRGPNKANGLKTLAVTTEPLESVITEEKAITAWGISVRNITKAYLRSRRMQPVEGVLVTGVREGSSAKEANLYGGDIITKVAGKKVTSDEQLQQIAEESQKTGKPIAVEIKRDRSDKVLVFKPRS